MKKFIVRLGQMELKRASNFSSKFLIFSQVLDSEVCGKLMLLLRSEYCFLVQFVARLRILLCKIPISIAIGAILV